MYIINIFRDVNIKPYDEITEILANGKNIRIEKIVSSGSTTDWYDQDEHEFVLVLEGCSVLEYDDGNKITLNKGDYIIIPPHKKHRVAYTSNLPNCIWLCVFWKD